MPSRKEARNSKMHPSSNVRHMRKSEFERKAAEQARFATNTLVVIVFVSAFVMSIYGLMTLFA